MCLGPNGVSIDMRSGKPTALITIASYFIPAAGGRHSTIFGVIPGMGLRSADSALGATASC